MLSVPLHEDEVLSSYVSRLAYAHGLYRMRTFCRDIGLNATKLKLGDDKEIQKLADLTDIPRNRLVAAAVTKGASRSTKFRGHTFHLPVLKREFLRFCPHCLAADLRTPSPYPGSQTYYRFIWFFPQVQTCIKHDRAIIEIDQPGSIESASQDFCSLLGNLPDGVEPLLALSGQRQPTSFELYIAARLAGERSPYKFLDALGLEAAIAMCERFGVASAFGHKAKVRKLSDEQLVFARDAGFKKLVKGKKGVFQILDKLAGQVAKTGAQSAHGLYGELYMALSVSFKTPEYEVFRDLIREHSRTQTIITGSLIFGSPAVGTLSRIQEVASELGLPPSRLKRALERKGRKSQLSSDRGAINSNLKQEVEDHVETVWTIGAARDFLGCDITEMPTLRKSGLLSTGAGYTIKECDKREVIDLDRRLRSKCVGTPIPTQVPISDAAWKTKTGYAHIIQLILTDKLPTVSVVEGQPILSGLRVLESEVAAAHFPPGTITALKAGALLKLNRNAIAYLITTGDLKASKLPAPRSIYWAVDQADVERFNREFISLVECEEATDRSANWLRVNARRQGIEPAFPTNKAFQAIYERRFADMIMTDVGV